MTKRAKRKQPKQSSGSEPQPTEILVDPARFENPDDPGSESEQARAQAASMSAWYVAHATAANASGRWSRDSSRKPGATSI